MEWSVHGDNLYRKIINRCVPIPMLLDLLGVEHNGYVKNIMCPFHDNRITPAATVYHNHYGDDIYCFSEKRKYFPWDFFHKGKIPMEFGYKLAGDIMDKLTEEQVRDIVLGKEIDVESNFSGYEGSEFVNGGNILNSYQVGVLMELDKFVSGEVSFGDIKRYLLENEQEIRGSVLTPSQLFDRGNSGLDILGRVSKDKYAFWYEKYRDFSNWRTLSFSDIKGDDELPEAFKIWVERERDILMMRAINGVNARSWHNKEFRKWGNTYLYGLDRLPDDYRYGDKYILICEGSGDRDVISRHYGYSVAVMGSSLGVFGAEVLRRVTDKVILAYDMDEAGEVGAVRDRDRLRENGVSTLRYSWTGAKDFGDWLDLYLKGDIYNSERLVKGFNEFISRC